MKVAVYYNLLFGGAKRVVKDQVSGLSALGNIVDVYTINYARDIFDPKPFSNKHFNYKLNESFANVPVIGKLFHIYNTFFKLKELNRKISEDINNRKYDIVLVHPDRFVQAPYILRFLRIKSVYYCQEPYRNAYEHSMRISEKFPLYNRIFEHIFRYLIKVVDRNNVKKATYSIASCNHIMEQMISAYNVYPFVVSPGVDVSVFKPLSKINKKGILFVGSKRDRIDGFDLLNDALDYFPKKTRPELKFVTWKKNNNERINEVELATIYSRSKITACMSRLETFGLIPLESMACGTPVIAINAGGHRETIVNGKTGYLVAHDPRKIADKIKKLMNSKSEYNHLSTQAVRHVNNNWNIDKKNKELNSLLKKLIKAS